MCDDLMCSKAMDDALWIIVKCWLPVMLLLLMS